MEIRCFASLPLQQDDPVSCIRQFVRVLREFATDSDHAQLDLNLVGTSARAFSTINEFRSQRAKGVPLSRALEVTEELTALTPAKIKSLHFMLSAEGFRWKGSSEGSSARLTLLDGQSLQRKQRFSLLANLHFQADDPAAPAVEQMLAAIATQTGIRFQKDASLMRFQPEEPGRATPEELFVLTLAWQELLASVSVKVQQSLSLDGIPHLMTTPEAHKFLFDPAKLGKSVPVNFARLARKWLKEEFPEFQHVDGEWDGEFFQRQLTEGLVVTLRLDKRAKAFSKEFRVWLGVGLTSPRFAPTPSRPLEFSVNLFQFFGIGPLPMQWTYNTETDLREALQACSRLTKQMLAIFEPEAAQMRDAHQRKLGEFAGPREISAREAYAIALPVARAHAADTALIRINTSPVTAQLSSTFPIVVRSLNDSGRLANEGAWRFIFHSRQKQENLQIFVPCYGPILSLRSDAPHGRQWPSDSDQILQDGWLDSPEIIQTAKKAVGEAIPSDAKPQLFELASRADVRAVGIPRSPMRDGMFKMEPAWRVSFSDRRDNGKGETTTIGTVTLPAYGEAPPSLELRTFDKLGRPTKP